jgi:hypothetical protein
VEAPFFRAPLRDKSAPTFPGRTLRDDCCAERHQRLARLAVLWIGEKRVDARRDEMIAVEGIGVSSIGERVAEAVQGKLRSVGPDEIVDRVAVVAWN